MAITMGREYKRPGQLVRYNGGSEAQIYFGRGDDPRGLLVIGELYSVSHYWAHTQHTTIILVEHPGKQFNSVMFTEL